MRTDRNLGNWRSRLRSFTRLIYPDERLKLFPPDFKLRDPVRSMVQRARRDGSQPALLLFHTEDYYPILKESPPELLEKLQSLMQEIFVQAAFAYVPNERIIGMRQPQADAIVLFVRAEEGGSLERLRILAGQIRDEFEYRLDQLLYSRLRQTLKIRTGFALIGDHPALDFGVDEAYHEAMEAVAHYVPAHFTVQNIMFEEIVRLENVSVVTQPIMDLKTGEIYGWEVLTRGPADSPFHSPDVLFEFASEAGALPALEWVVICKALREMAERQIKEQVFINLTPVSLSDPSLLERLLEKMEELGIAPGQIVFEITERHSIRDYEHMSSVLRSYRTKGFRFAVDDAGSGYSSLQSISELIPDIIKIDKSLIRNIDRESVKQALLRSLLYFAENMDCTVIAEGVEREEEANVLLQNRVHMGQGYYFARPEPFEMGRNVVHFATLKEKIIHMHKQAANQ